MHEAAVAKAHFVLGWMHIDIHRRRIEFEKQHIGGMAPVVEHVVVSLPDRVADDLVAHDAAVDVEILQIRLAAGEGRQADPSPQRQPGGALVDGNRIVEKGRAANEADPAPLFGFPRRRAQIVNQALVVPQAEAHIEAAQGHPLEHFFEAGEFGSFGFEELLARRGVEEQVAHFHRGAHAVLAGFKRGFHLLAFGADRPAGFALARRGAR